MKKTIYTVDQIDAILCEHVIRGDRGDGIPNVLSDDNCLIEKRRQTKITADRLEILRAGLDLNADTEQRLQRNRLLIDLRNVPIDLRHNIVSEFALQADKPKSKMFGYFVKFRLKNLLEDIGDF